MGGKKKWTQKGVDEEFLRSKIPEYQQTNGAARKKNIPRRAFINAVIDEYREKFAGRLESMDLSGCGVDGSEAERTSAIIAVSYMLCSKVCANSSFCLEIHRLV